MGGAIILFTSWYYFFSNWGTEIDPEFKSYHNGNAEPKGFGKFFHSLSI